MNILLVAATVCLLGISFTNGIPMRCTQIAQTMIFDEYDYGNITGSSFLSVYLRDGVQYVSISNVDVFDYHVNASANRVCQPGGSCTYDLTAPFEMQIGNTTFAVDAYIPGTNGIEFFHGIVDEQSFYSVVDGSIFTLDNMCSTQTSDQDNLIMKEIHCCMAFQPVPQVPANSNPRCTKFQSRSSILNVDDNYSIFATSTMTFYLNGNSLSGEGNFSGPSDYSVDHWYNENWMCIGDIGGTNEGCSDVQLPNGDSRGLIRVDFTKWNISSDGSGSGQGYVGMLGRILIRDGQILMEEGNPFTAKNNCFYKNYPFGGNPNQVVNNQFCCTEFESSFHPKHQSRKPKNTLSHPPSYPPGFVKHSPVGRNNIRRLSKQK